MGRPLAAAASNVPVAVTNRNAWPPVFLVPGAQWPKLQVTVAAGTKTLPV
jgi:hypothetical protein